MRRRAPLACLLAGLVLSLGCAQCASPWDYCGPVYAGGPCNACIVDERMGSAFTGGPGMIGPMGEMGDYDYYDGDAVYDGRSAPYEQPYSRDAEPMPTPADDEERSPEPMYDESLPPLEPPTFDDAMPPLTPPRDSDALPPLQTPPSTARRTSFSAAASSPSEGAQAAQPRANAPAAVAAAPAAKSATASPTSEQPKGWQSASSKGRFRR